MTTGTQGGAPVGRWPWADLRLPRGGGNPKQRNFKTRQRGLNILWTVKPSLASRASFEMPSTQGAVVNGWSPDETLWGKGFCEGSPVAPRQVARSTGDNDLSNRLKRALTPLVPSRFLSRSDRATTN